MMCEHAIRWPLSACGDGIQVFYKKPDRFSRELVDVYEPSPVIFTGDLGGNNGDNEFGWCGDKFIVYYDGELVLLDFAYELFRAECCRLVKIGEGAGVDLAMCRSLGIPHVDLRIKADSPVCVTRP